MITLKNVKLNEMMSEETPCFSADLYENGKLLAYVSNRGHGGSNEIRPIEGKSYKDVRHLDTLDAECDIMTMAEDITFLKKNQSNNFVLKKLENYYTQKAPKSFTRCKKAPNYKEWLKREITKLKGEGYTILNTNL
jgi:hypothetical protein